MNIPCKITANCIIHPSEDPEKIRMAFDGILLDAKVVINENTAIAVFENINCLDKIRTVIESRKNQNTYRKRLVRNMTNTRTEFLLNKQAAYANKVALCDVMEDSPLGAIRIIIDSHDMERLLEWLVPST